MATYNELIKDPISDKRVIFEMEKGITYDDGIWIKEEPLIWKSVFSNYAKTDTTSWGYGAYSQGPYGGSSTVNITEGFTGYEPTINFGSILINGEPIFRVFSLDDLRGTNEAFYWDEANQTIYMRYDNIDPNYDLESIVIGIIKGYSDWEGWIGDYFFEGRIQSIPQISNKKDPLYFGLISFDGGTVKLDNTDGHFDNLDDDDIYGQKVRIKFGFKELALDDYETVYSGFFESFNISQKDCIIKIRDPRKNISRSIPIDNLIQTDYPDLSDGNIGSPVPLGYGTIIKQPTVCLNEEDEVTSTFDFVFVDTNIHPVGAVSKVYNDNKSVAFTDNSDGTFTLSNAVYESGDEVTVSYYGYNITNPLEIIEDLLAIFANISYTEYFYNLTEWEEVKALVPDIGLSIWEDKTIIDIIGNISTTLQGLFIFQGDGLITYKLRDPDKTHVDTISVADQMKTTVQKNMSDEYTSSIRVGFNKNWTKEEFAFITDKSNEDELFKKYRTYKQREFQTLLTNATDAQSFSDNIYNQFGGIFPTFTFKTKTQFLDLELEDNIYAFVYFSEDRVRKYKLEIIGTNINYTTSEMTIVGRYIMELLIGEDIIVEWDADPDYLIEWDANPDYILDGGL